METLVQKLVTRTGLLTIAEVTKGKSEVPDSVDLPL
jgi:hypothetical protein